MVADAANAVVGYHQRAAGERDVLGEPLQVSAPGVGMPSGRFLPVTALQHRDAGELPGPVMVGLVEDAEHAAG